MKMKKKKRLPFPLIIWRKINYKNKKQLDKDIKLTLEVEQQRKLEEFFLQGRKEYLNLFQGCPVALVYTNIDGIIRYANYCFEQLTGFTEEELKGNSLIYYLAPEEASVFLELKQNSFEATIYKKNHSSTEVMVNRTCNQIDNRIAGMIFSFQDISLLKREKKYQQTLYKISQVVHSELPLSEIYSQVHEQLKKVIVADNFYIALWDNKLQKFSFPYYCDEAAGDNEVFIQRYSTTQSIFHYIMKIGQPILMDFQRYRKMLSYGYIEPWDVMTNTHLWLAAPLKLEKHIIGVIALQSYDNARLYSEKDIDLLEFVAQELSCAIFRKSPEAGKISIIIKNPNHNNYNTQDSQKKSLLPNSELLRENSREENQNRNDVYA